MSPPGVIPGPEMGATARPVSCWSLPLWSMAPLLSVLLPGWMRTVGLLLLPVTLVGVLLSRRSGLPAGWLYGMLLGGLPLPLSFAVAQDAGGYPNPCQLPEPPAWCATYQPPAAEYIPGTLRPRLPEPAADSGDDRQDGPQRWLLASTVAEPPAVIWIGGKPADSVQLFGANRSQQVDRALELILPEGWQVFASPSPGELAGRLTPPLLWNGGGRAWPEVLEELAARYGLSLVADVPRREITITEVLPPQSGGYEIARAALNGQGTPADSAPRAEPRNERPPVVVETVPLPAASAVPAVPAAEERPVDPCDLPNRPAWCGSQEAPVQGAAPVAAAAPEAPETPAPAPVVGVESHPLHLDYRRAEWLTVKPLPATRSQVASRLLPAGVEVDMSILGSLQTSPVYSWDLESVKVSPKNALAKILPDGYCVNDDAFPKLVVVPCGGDPAAGS